MTGLSTIECEVLAFEEGWWNNQATKTSLIRERFGWSATKYYQELATTLAKPEALEYDPVLVARLRRLQEQRRAVR